VVEAIIQKLVFVIVTPLLTLVFAVAFIVFLWGVFQYLIATNDPDGRTTGTQHILWGVIGMAIMVSAYGIINFVAQTIQSIR
jgi:ABC-type thiamin/hydroxymethylpyrimidine transport system permease subunit